MDPRRWVIIEFNDEWTYVVCGFFSPGLKSMDCVKLCHNHPPWWFSLQWYWLNTPLSWSIIYKGKCDICHELRFIQVKFLVIYTIGGEWSLYCPMRGELSNSIKFGVSWLFLLAWETWILFNSICDSATCFSVLLWLFLLEWEEKILHNIICASEISFPSGPQVSLSVQQAIILFSLSHCGAILYWVWFYESLLRQLISPHALRYFLVFLWKFSLLPIVLYSLVPNIGNLLDNPSYVYHIINALCSLYLLQLLPIILRCLSHTHLDFS